MLKFPMHNAALDLVGKPPGELPHGLLPIPPEVRELVEMQREKHRPEVFEANREALTQDWTVHWYFDNLGQEVLYRRTLGGPEVLAVGFDEVWSLQKSMPLEEQLKLKVYQD